MVLQCSAEMNILAVRVMALTGITPVHIRSLEGLLSLLSVHEFVCGYTK